MNTSDMSRIMEHLRADPVVRAVHDAKSEEIGPGIYRFKAEIGGGISKCVGSEVWKSMTPRAGRLDRHLPLQGRDSITLQVLYYFNHSLTDPGSEVVDERPPAAHFF